MIDMVDGVTQGLALHSDSPIRRRFVCADRTYALMLSRDLLGDWVVMQTWGSRINKHGGGKSRAFATFEAGLAALTALARVRQERGYQLVE
jgi:predicted DNA-binding WGR domain protein